ncbi:hypothetical protein [Desulfosarcina cetonica]|uniref:hypothetical protein n=1 Tax=Desulfosarcina cetonica TaxID=90730 RepID=UPI0006CFB6AA|nr:hypothetical protein [Desulfosarcina cetonica]
MIDTSKFNPTYLQAKAPEIFAIARHTHSVDDLRASLARMANEMMFEAFDDYDTISEGSIVRVRDCAKVMIRLMTRRSEDKARFSVARAIFDIAHNNPRQDLTPAFYAELLYLFLGLQGRGPGSTLADLHLIPSRYAHRKAAIERSRQLDELYAEMNLRLTKFVSGLDQEAVKQREARQQQICARMQASIDQWKDWTWQVAHILREADEIAQLLKLRETEYQAIQKARANGLPFGITPYYLSLMDDTQDAEKDRAIRAQVIPSPAYVEKMAEAQRFGHCLDFMLEADTSPIDLITRRYPSICIFKPFNTCPQICVYCQRNWEIDDAMQPGAMASQKKSTPPSSGSAPIRPFTKSWSPAATPGHERCRDRGHPGALGRYSNARTHPHRQPYASHPAYAHHGPSRGHPGPLSGKWTSAGRGGHPRAAQL